MKLVLSGSKLTRAGTEGNEIEKGRKYSRRQAK
jgi:hypothetical protein